MNWRHIKLIFRREMRDQLRDRRTLFLIAVLPLLFYPLLGISFFQIAQFLREHPNRILIVGHEATRPDLPALIRDNQFAQGVYDPDKAHLMELEFLPVDRLRFVREGKWPKSGQWTDEDRAELNSELHRLMKRNDCDAVLFFPPNFFHELETWSEALKEHAKTGVGAPPKMPQSLLIFDTSSERKALARFRVEETLNKWSAAVGKFGMEGLGVTSNAADPISISKVNVAPENRINTSLWSKILPFVLLIWAVTGAFYPAVDLCAGEKERGTLETLLSSPARRGEIVLGKLLTVMVFSLVTAVLNLVSIGITGAVVLSRLGDMAEMANVGPPPFAAMFWLSLILIPVAALFGAVCLALAAFARSTKEGQYYLMPVILVAMPLILLPMKPDAELNFGFSLIPVSGIVLLMRSVMEGTIVELWPYAFPVAAVTFGCCWLSLRWAIDQFNSEEVLFREGERWDVISWLRHVFLDRQPTPTVALAVLCGVLVLIIKFFLPGIISFPSISQLRQIEVADLVKITVVTQVFMVLAPAVFLALLTTRRPTRSLQLTEPPLMSLPAAALLPITLFPLVIALQLFVGHIIEPRPEIQKYATILDETLSRTPLWLSVVLVALLPAVCEELTFRGFILSGFRHSGHKWRAIAFTAFFFAVAHPIVEQKINAFFLGFLLGYLAVQTGSVWPPLIYHFVHNATIYVANRQGILEQVLIDDRLAAAALFVGTILAVFIIFWFSQLNYGRTKEESLQEALQARVQ